jgi:transposase
MLCTYSTEKLLGLKGVIVKNVRQLPDKTEIFIELPRKPHVCPCCGYQTSYVHDYRCQTVKDIPAFGKHTSLILRKRRYRCSLCGKRFFEDNSFLPRYHRITNRLAAYIISKLSDVRSFTSVAREVNLSVSTIIRLFDCIHYGKPQQLPEVVSIDEFKGNTSGEKYQCILTDPVRHRILDILPARYNHKLTEYFGQLDRSQTKHFVSDMWSTYAGIAQTYFKDSNYVIDKYHYIRQVFWAFEATFLHNCPPWPIQPERFHHRTNFIRKTYNITLPIFWRNRCQRPHMPQDDILFPLVQRKLTPCVFQCRLRVRKTVQPFSITLFMPVVKKKVVQQSAANHASAVD